MCVGDAPEGFAISPKGGLAVAALLGGASVPKTACFNTKRNGSLAVLKIDGKKVTKVGEMEVVCPRAWCGADAGVTGSVAVHTCASICPPGPFQCEARPGRSRI